MRQVELNIKQVVVGVFMVDASLFMFGCVCVCVCP